MDRGKEHREKKCLTLKLACFFTFSWIMIVLSFLFLHDLKKEDSATLIFHKCTKLLQHFIKFTHGTHGGWSRANNTFCFVRVSVSIQFYYYFCFAKKFFLRFKPMIFSSQKKNISIVPRLTHTHIILVLINIIFF